MANASRSNVLDFPVPPSLLFDCDRPEVIASVVLPLRMLGIVVDTVENPLVGIDRVSVFRPTAIWAVDTWDSVCAAKFCKCFVLLRSNDLHGQLPSPKVLYVGEAPAYLCDSVTECVPSLSVAKKLVEMSLSPVMASTAQS